MKQITVNNFILCLNQVDEYCLTPSLNWLCVLNILLYRVSLLKNFFIVVILISIDLTTKNFRFYHCTMVNELRLHIILSEFDSHSLPDTSAFNKSPEFFEQAFKIAVDSWKFTMLLLYILWDDRPIFMTSGSNEQLQQQLEYTLLKPDSHSWWIFKNATRTWEHFRWMICNKILF